MRGTLAALWHTLAGLAKVVAYAQTCAIPCDDAPSEGHFSRFSNFSRVPVPDTRAHAR